jgi:hypothetical protein
MKHSPSLARRVSLKIVFAQTEKLASRVSSGVVEASETHPIR